jgi:hypothetical protein
MWNYRLIEDKSGGETNIGLFEVYYDTEGKPSAWCAVSLEHFDDTRQIENALGLMEGALYKPVLQMVDGVLKEKV